MFESIKAKIVFDKLFTKPDIQKAYAMKGPEDSWYDTLKKVHDSLNEIQKLPHEQIEIKSFDGHKLSAVHYPCKNVEPKGTVVFIHGYTSHAEREWAFPGLYYLSKGYNVIIPYQRAHGPSEGKYITFGALERKDMILWLEKVQSLYPDMPVVIHGLSMGGGIALQLSSLDNKNVKCIIADAPTEGVGRFLASVARENCKQKSAKFEKKLKNLFKKKTGEDASVTEVRQYVEKSNFPIYFTAGSKENSYKRLKNLQEICPMPTKLVILSGCNHGNGMYKQTKTYQSELGEFLDLYVK